MITTQEQPITIGKHVRSKGTMGRKIEGIVTLSYPAEDFKVDMSLWWDKSYPEWRKGNVAVVTLSTPEEEPFSLGGAPLADPEMYETPQKVVRVLFPEDELELI